MPVSAALTLDSSRAGWRTAWQVEINPTNRALLAYRFPGAQLFADVRDCGAHNLAGVDCIAAGFPCQDISNAGGRGRNKRPHGLDGARSGLFFEAIRIVREVQPAWLVFENVEALLHSQGGRDFERVLAELADSGYLGFWRVLDAQHFGLPQRRRRIFLVAGRGRYPSLEYLADAEPVEAIPSSLAPVEQSRPADRWPGYTLLALNAACRMQLGGENFVAHPDGWREMAERQRRIEVLGLPWGLDGPNLARRYSAGNAVCPPVARWIAEKLSRS